MNASSIVTADEMGVNEAVNQWGNKWMDFVSSTPNVFKIETLPGFIAHLKWHGLQSLPWLSLWEMAHPPSLHHSIRSNNMILCIEFTYIYIS